MCTRAIDILPEQSQQIPDLQRQTRPQSRVHRDTDSRPVTEQAGWVMESGHQGGILEFPSTGVLGERDPLSAL